MRLAFVLFVVACAPSKEGPEYWAVMPDGRTTQVEAVAPEYARSRWLSTQPTTVCSGPGECRDVIGMRACPSPGTIICFDADQTKCIQCGHEKIVLRLR